MKSYKENIANSIIANGSLTINQQKQIDKIREGIDYAWNNWDEKVVQTYYNGQKPEYPTADFISQWVDNEDFEADGYDVDYLIELFG